MGKLRKINLKKILKICTKVSLGLFAVLMFCMWAFRYNITESEPIGIYVKQPFKSIEVGDYVVFPIPEKYKDYIKSVDEEASSTFIKNVSAKKGDHVKLVGDDVYINDKLIAKRFKLKGIDNPEIDKVLEDGEYISISKNIYSFDSRYYGIIKKENILGVYKYTHLFETKKVREFNKQLFGQTY